jgi:uncharacterized protein YprB with RNaseH-like and TPR domain
MLFAVGGRPTSISCEREEAMLRHTFCHIPGVGAETERRLWSAGITSWDSVLDQEPPRLAPVARRLGTSYLRESIKHYDDHNPLWFGQHLPSDQSWRLFRDFRDCCAYLDIETTGMGKRDQITTIALYDGQTIRHYIQGENLDDFAHDVARYRLLVTYNGKAFDVPFIERCLQTQVHQAHIDLRHVLRSLGFRGGLKACEKNLGVQRPGMEDLDGFAAVLLWQDYRSRKNLKALQTLLAYNVQDTLNLETLMVLAYNRKLAELHEVPFASKYQVEMPQTPANPFPVDLATVQRILHTVAWGYPFSW